jgi:hypothetical protein
MNNLLQAMHAAQVARWKSLDDLLRPRCPAGRSSSLPRKTSPQKIAQSLLESRLAAIANVGRTSGRE